MSSAEIPLCSPHRWSPVASLCRRITLVAALVLPSGAAAPALLQAQQAHEAGVVQGVVPSVARGVVQGVVRDPLGARVPGATVELLEAARVLVSASSDAEGRYVLPLPAAGRYRVRVRAEDFETSTTAPADYKLNGEQAVDVTLATATETQQVTVTATGTPTPEAQTGAAVTVLPADGFPTMAEVQEPLRLAPGVQITQTGQMGGTAGLSIRGGDTDANKVLIDGVPANQIGGAVEFANLATVGIANIETLNEPDSVLYGADALAGVVHLTTRRAPATALPLLTYSGDGGNFGTYRNDVSASTVYRGFDLFSEYGRLQTNNSLPNSQFHNGTYVGNFGWAPDARNDFRLIARHTDVRAGQPNAIALYGIADDAQQQEHDLYLSGTWTSQTTARWNNLVRYAYARLDGQFNDFQATGIYDPNTGVYDGAPVTITGANGYTVSGQAVFEYSDGSAPYLERNRDSSVYAQTDYRIGAHLMALGAFRYESERGAAEYQGSDLAYTGRGNYDYSTEFSGDIANRLFYTAGSGLENNGLYGFAATPRASLAYYLLRPSTAGLFNGTKLHGTFGKGIKEPSVYQQGHSLYGELDAGQALQYSVGPLGPEHARSFDAGVDQQLLGGRARLGITWFHNQFTDRVEFVPQSALVALGIAAANAQPVAENGGAYLNSLAFRSLGAETTLEVRVSRRLFARGGYTYTDAVVQRSFSSDNGSPSYNTASNFANLPIGAFSPLVGARPFRIAPHSGFFALNYTRPRFFASLTGSLVGPRDDSDFLYDKDFGTSLLLPNRNLLGAYQRLELGAGYNLTHRLEVYSNLQNLLGEHYFEAFGYPSLPFTFRSGITFNLGGESWSLR